MTEQKGKLQIGISGNEYVFTENPELVEYLQKRYPMLKLEATLSLSAYAGMNTIHPLEVSCYIREGLTYDSIPVQDSVVDAVVDYLDKVVHSMYRAGITGATVYMSRIELAAKTSATSLKTELDGKLRAVFVQDKKD